MVKYLRDLTKAEQFETYRHEHDEDGQPIWGWLGSEERGRFWVPSPKGWRPPPPQVPDDPRDMLDELWEFGRRRFEDILQLWGSASELMGKHWLFGRDGETCRDWVRHLEHLVRAILLIAALTLNVVLPIPKESRPKESLKRTIDPDAPPPPDEGGRSLDLDGLAQDVSLDEGKGGPLAAQAQAAAQARLCRRRQPR